MSESEEAEVKAAARSADADALAEGWGAFVKARAAFKPVALDRTNPHFKSKYASLASVLSAVTPALTANGLAVVTRTFADGDTLLAKTSVFYRGLALVSSVMPIAKGGASAQAVGSALTYARRYSICALLGIVADEDDDGNAAQAGAAKAAAEAGF